jgi:two-component system osmolarity sensor histidine kinase EnvZ
MLPKKFALSLFWRTFILLALLLTGGIAAWVAALQKLESEPRVVLAAQQIASLVNLSREGLRTTDPINRVALVKAMSAREAIELMPREPGDRWQPFEQDAFTRRVGSELRSRVGPDAIAARSVNGRPGLWVGFAIDKDAWWLRAEAARIQPLGGGTWLAWAGIALLATVLGSVVIARLINRPLRNLALAAGRVRDGQFGARLDESSLTTEIRDLNVGFNRMAHELARIEQDRNVMLAGISHDLRTPLARLRLEAELGVVDEQTRTNIADDIAQLDAIIGKFMDYARPGATTLRPVPLKPLVEAQAAAFRSSDDLRITVEVAANLLVQADAVELGRVFGNLFENARRYGRSGGTGVARVQVNAAASGSWVECTVRDHGPGVAPDKLDRLTTPFFRGDAARSATVGAGLGLAIVERTLQRLGGTAEVSNAAGGGLQVQLRLQRAN